MRYSMCAAGALILAGCVRDHATPAAAIPGILSSGIDLQYVDPSVRVQDDTYRHLNGKWLDTFQLPADKGNYGAFSAVSDATQDQLRSIIEDLSPPHAGAVDPDARKIANLYASFMDESQIESRGLAPLQSDLAAIDALLNKRSLPQLIAHLQQLGANVPYDLSIDQDARDSTRYAVILNQSGLGMPDRDYYLKDDAKLKDIRAKYLAHVEKMLSMAGDVSAKTHAAAVLQLETDLARIQWARVANRDPVKTYNKTSIADLAKLLVNYDWNAYVQGAGFAGSVDYVVVRQPSYIAGLAQVIEQTPLPVWKSYFRFHVLAAAAPFLSKAFVDERFNFSGTVLRGIPENRPRWKRGVALVDSQIGEALGRYYVERYFPPASKARMEALVAHLLDAYRRDVGTLDWMSPETKVGAQAKLSKLAVKIGYPRTWRDYSALAIDPQDLWGNITRAEAFEYRRSLQKLGKPIDRDEWEMTPQTINAYYNPPMNEIVFPAAILQPPFFDVHADDAVNYGAIGAIIGHEMSHGFDDRGSQYDADGNLHDWFTTEDHEKFSAKTHALIAQYDAYEPVPGFHVNGQLTLGENIADNSGLSIAYKAYRLSLAGKSPPDIDGLTGDARFYLGFVQVWRQKIRESEALQLIKTDPHSPADVRGTAPLRNQSNFYGAFNDKAGDKMFLAPEQRVDIW